MAWYSIMMTPKKVIQSAREVYWNIKKEEKQKMKLEIRCEQCDYELDEEDKVCMGCGHVVIVD